MVKTKGYFNEDRFFVRKNKDSNLFLYYKLIDIPGYLVFAPFITAIDYPPLAKR